MPLIKINPMEPPKSRGYGRLPVFPYPSWFQKEKRTLLQDMAAVTICVALRNF